ncbi:hypothetical protein J2X63_003214 [Agromyces sp. 3263]|uniref:hypothetical protein n=1 Tax=Agromyces sp. 3263 TaxID=2817750 RepID=UPI00285885D2|nr:hypothetical protein [Agromyces sp. 3263]MDR6907506.1 hypothetical protein [Agromyces sp. 3263]
MTWPKFLSALSLVAACVLILGIIASAKAGDVGWVIVYAIGLGVIAVGRAIELLIEEKVKP